jgi:hypothetical protein
MSRVLGEKIGFKDKVGEDLRVGHKVKTYDSKGKEWVGEIVPTSLKGSSPIIRAGGIQYAFKSNYETWIHDQEYASELEIMEAGVDFIMDTRLGGE